MNNRRSSQYSNNGYSPQRPPRMSPGGGYYRNSSYGFAPQSSVEEVPGAAQMYGRPQRQHSNPYQGYPNGNQNGYPNGHQNGHSPVRDGPMRESPVSQHSYHHSYDNMTSGSEDYGKSTNPSSQNSSFDQLHQVRKPEDYSQGNPYSNDITFNQVSPTKPFSPYALNDSSDGQDFAPPPIPAKQFAANNPRVPIKLNSSPTDQYVQSPEPTTSPKKQSWIKRRFSRREKD